MEQTSFGEVLRGYRVAAGLTQEALAERSGVSPRGISDLERGARKHPFPATVRRLAEALGLPDADRSVLQDAAYSPARAYQRPSPHAGRLPAPVSSFVGREQEVEHVRRALTATRLITLLGPGGIGKSRLAVEAAAGVVDQFADGVTFVALASVRDPDLVSGAVAQALDIQEMGTRALLDRLHSHLRTAHLLLVLDNFEHVLPAADLVGSLLANCPRLRVLVTSRAALRISGEREIAVHPLALPDPHNLPPARQLAGYEAIRLFVERGRNISSDLELTDQQTKIVAEICARLDGLPLAIELAAARLRVLPLEMLLERLERRLPQLVGGPRDAPARQQTLTATIGWSYDLLEPHEQRLFRGLSVFAGAFTLEAAESVCHDADLGDTVVDGLESLLAQSLIGRQAGPPGAAWFRMLETVREFALEQAIEAEQSSGFRRRHAAYYLELGEQAQPNFSSVDAPRWLLRLEAEHDNLRAALGWALEEHDADSAVRLSSAIWQFWYAHGHLTEGARWLDEALRLPAASSGQPMADGRVSARARALAGAGILAHYQGDYARAATLCGQSLGLSRQVDDQLCTATALHGLALVSRSGADFATARTMLQEARRIHEALGDQWGLSYTLRYLAVVLWMEADYGAAEQAIDAALALATSIGDRQGAATTLTVRSYVARSLDKNHVAETAALESLSLHDAYGDRRGGGQALWALGMALAGQGRCREALAHYKRALALFAEIGDRYFICMCWIGLAELALAAGRPRDAVCLLAASSRVMAAMGAPLWPSIEPYVQRSVEQAHGSLSQSAYAAAWAAGEALTLESAVALGLGVPEVVRAANGLSGLTAREVSVARRLAHGLTNKQIAEELVIAEGTADRHVANILEKLGFRSRAQVAAWVVEHTAELGN
jgi:predicted ATPase/DNA-binding CsgD family transcriptional regulator/DNA-binding XRE family transcriptional regulator